MLQTLLSELANKVASHAIVLLVGFAGAFFLFQENCSGPGEPNRVDSFTEIEYKDLKIEFSEAWWDLTPDTVTKPVYVDTGGEFDTAEFMANLDTMAIVEDYYKRRGYSRSFGDSNFTASLKAQVWRNRLDSLSFDYELNYREKTTTKTIEKTNPGPRFITTFTAGHNYYQPGVLIRTGNWYVGGGYEIGRNIQNGFRVTGGYSF